MRLNRTRAFLWRDADRKRVVQTRRSFKGCTAMFPAMRFRRYALRSSSAEPGLGVGGLCDDSGLDTKVAATSDGGPELLIHLHALPADVARHAPHAQAACLQETLIVSDGLRDLHGEEAADNCVQDDQRRVGAEEREDATWPEAHDFGGVVVLPNNNWHTKARVQAGVAVLEAVEEPQFCAGDVHEIVLDLRKIHDD